MIPTPNTVAIRSVVRSFLAQHEAGDCILVAVSGGADSLALAYAISKEALLLSIKVIGVTIDHQLQSGSGEQAKKLLLNLIKWVLLKMKSQK